MARAKEIDFSSQGAFKKKEVEENSENIMEVLETENADDVFSVAALKYIYPSFKLIRTRDMELISKADVVIDVGGEHNPETGRFDHHQRGGAGARENGIPFSSFGLICYAYTHHFFGHTKNKRHPQLK